MESLLNAVLGRCLQEKLPVMIHDKCGELCKNETVSHYLLRFVAACPLVRHPFSIIALNSQRMSIMIHSAAVTEV